MLIDAVESGFCFPNSLWIVLQITANKARRGVLYRYLQLLVGKGPCFR